MMFFATIGAMAFALPLVFLLAILSSLWRTWWLYPAWAWFMVPLGLPQISFWHCAALMYLVHIMTVNVETKKDDRPVAWSSIGVILISPILAWAVLKWMAA